MIAGVIGELLAAVCDDESILARLGGPIGDAARDAAGELAQLPAMEARAWRVRLLAAMRSPLPPGIRGAHGSWIEAGLADLPPRARSAVATGSPDAVDVWLSRWACAEIPPLPAIDPALVTPRSIEEAPRLGGEALLSWLSEVGADQLAYALASQPEALRAISRVVGERVIAAAARITTPPRHGSLGPTRDAIARCRGDAQSHLLLRIGARAIAPHTDVLIRRQLAVRLPRSLGLAVLSELTAHGDKPAVCGPSWIALGAGS